MRGPNVVYVGNLPTDIKERELQELFDKVGGLARCAAASTSPLSPLTCPPFCWPQFGSIRAIDIKIPPRPPPFAFIEFDDPR